MWMSIFFGGLGPIINRGFNFTLAGVLLGVGLIFGLLSIAQLFYVEFLRAKAFKHANKNRS